MASVQPPSGLKYTSPEMLWKVLSANAGIEKVRSRRNINKKSLVWVFMIVIPYYLIDLLCPGCSQQEFQDVPPADREESQEQRPVSIVSR
jgi:hypothetical protein